MRIAIVGTGIAGLAAAWRLGQQHHITLYEKQPELGMAARGLEWGGARVDMPLRVLYPGYYPSLVRLYADAGIQTVAADYSASFSDADGQTYFRYRNWQPASGISLPYLPASHWLQPSSWRIGADILRLSLRARRDRARLQDRPQTLQDYLRDTGYSRAFAEDFLLPSFAAISTCDISAVRYMPAAVILEYLSRGVLLGGVARTRLGADHVVATLSSRADRIHLGAGIASIQRTDAGISVIDENGQQAGFDHVVMATQANQVARLVDDLGDAESRMLAGFSYQPSKVVVHRDGALMPRRRQAWSPVNFALQRQAERPQATIWLNAVLPIDGGAPDAFQTWNPLQHPAPETILAEAHFERPLVTLDSEAALRALDTLHREPDRRLWFCGSYARAGVPLLESAARSAEQVAERIGPHG